MSYNCILSVGIRCFTEIFLKEIGYKKFSGPFDGMYCQTIEPIIDFLSNGINENDLIYSEEEINMNILNIKHGNRTIHKKYNFNKENPEESYHNALFPHHNLKKEDIKQHFHRCFERLKIIEKKQIRTLFCLFFHPRYGNDKEISIDDIKKIEKYLTNKYNCKLLVCNFCYLNDEYEWKIISNNDSLINIHVNNNSHIFTMQKKNLNEIFAHIGIDNDKLISYENINKFI